MATYSKPYDAIFKRAEEVFNAGQKQDALQLLHDLITSRRYRAWQKVHEKIKSKYIELSVDMRRGRFDKLDDLIQHCIICQQVIVTSLAKLARSHEQALKRALEEPTI
ncbi:eukaryotic translation initiation factor 3 subunit A-like protein [Tanacetum coccineum]